MLSKWQIWDFFSSFDRQYLASYQGVLALSTFDPLCLKLTKEYLFKGATEKVIHHKVASDISRDWLDEEFQALSLFGNTDCFYIHQAQDLSADLIAQITDLKIEGRFVILSFETEGASWKRLLKEGKIDVLQIEAPKFWETAKLLDFAAAYLRLPLGYEAKNWILASQENDLGTLYNCCSLIKLNFPESREVGLKEVQELLTVERLDQFALAGLFVRKKHLDFFEKLLPLKDDFDRARGLFNFLQSHLIKLADTSYMASKPRLTQYDKDLQSGSRLWKTEDLMQEIARFNRWELMSKKRDFLLWHELKVAHLQTFGRV